MDHVYTWGIESKVALRLTSDLLVSTGYAYLDARDKDAAA